MKDFKTFVKIAFWVATTAVVWGGIVFCGSWWEYSSQTVGIAMVLLWVAIFAVMLIAMVLLDIYFDAKEERKRIKYTRDSHRDARCKGYVDVTWKEKK
jgi:type III secretory pathway component EscU